MNADCIEESVDEGDSRTRGIAARWVGGVMLLAMAYTSGALAQGFPNITRTEGELLAGPIAPEQGRTAIVAWHGERIVSVPEAPGSQNGADVNMRVVNIEDPQNPVVTEVPAHASGFHAHGYYQSGPYLFVGPHCLGEALDECNGTFPHDFYANSFRIGGSGTAIGDSQLRRADLDSETGLLLGSVQRAGAQSPWGLNDFWTYGAIGGDMWLAVRRNNEWVYDWGNGGAATGPAIKASWDHLALTGVTGFPFIMGNILIVASDQAGSGVATYDISDLANPVLLDVLKDSNPGGYWPEIYSHYIFFPRRDGEGGVGSSAGYMVVDFSDPTNLRIVANRNLPGSNQYVTFQDEYAFMNRYKIDMRDFDVALTLNTVPGVIDASQFALPVGNLVVTGGYGLDGPGLAIWAHQEAPDTRAPYVAYHMPRPDQINYSVDCPITLSIPETLKTETIVDGSSLILRPVGGLAIPTWHSFGQGKLLTVTPQQPLLPSTTYELLLTSDIEDAAGNGLEPFSFRFSTGSSLAGGNRPPQIASLTTTPGSPAPGVLTTITWAASDLDGDALEYRVDFGDGTPLGLWNNTLGTTHTYADAGHYQLTLQVRDSYGAVSASSRKVTVASPPAAPNSTASSQLALDANAQRLYAVNPDNNTVTCVDTQSQTKLWEAAVGRHPMGLALGNDGSVWTACRDSDALHVLSSTGQSLATLGLDYGAAPVAIAATPDGASMLVSLEGDASLARFTVATRTPAGTLPLGPSPRAIAVTQDGTRALVTRFISPEHNGQVYDVALGGGMSLTRVITLARDNAVDSSASGRGVPNYLATIRITPDGEWAWVAGKKDNTTRGTFFAPTMTPGQDSTVRAMLTLIHLDSNAEDPSRRLDLDNSESPSALAFSPLGDYAFVTLQGNNQVGVIDVLDFMLQSSPGTIGSRWSTGLAPQAVAVNPLTGQVFSNDFMGRSVTIFSAAEFLASGALNVPSIAVDSVASERLHPEVLRGKQIFYNASDPRMSAEGYISCASCHIDGGHDGRTWDFTNRGEGFRNTTDLRGRSGMGHGNVHWSANFDEIQDFENDIRAFFGGDGFLSDGQHAATANSLGAPKAGLNEDLDALAAYVSSLGPASLPRNPQRQANGALSDAAARGAAVFAAQNCATCHVPSQDYTDRQMHDVGTLSALSGQRLGGVLSGIDTPSLLGAHASAPYFHDGRAATLADVFTTTGGRLVQAEAATLSGGAYGEDVGWLAMKEWHAGQFVELDGARTVGFEDVNTTEAGPGYIEVRYNVRYGTANMNVVVNGGAPQGVALAQTPNMPGYVPGEWRSIRVPVTYQAGLNSIVLSKVSGGQLVVDDVLFSTPDDAAAASAHVRNLDPDDLTDLVAYLSALDSASAAQPAAEIRRGAAVIAQEGTDAVDAGVVGQSSSLVYTITNTGAGILDLGEFHVEAAPDGEIWVAQQPAPQVPPGESTTLSLGTLLTSSEAVATVRGWSSTPGVEALTWTIAATAEETGGGCAGVCLEVASSGPALIRREVGDEVTFSVSATGDAPITYQWYRELPDKAVVELGSTPSMTLTNLQLTDSGIYFCVVEDANELVQTADIELEVVASLPAAGYPALLLVCFALAWLGGIRSRAAARRDSKLRAR